MAVGLAVIVGAAVAGGSSSWAPGIGPAVADAGSAAPAATPVAYVPRPSPWAVPSPTVDPATFEGAGALAATTIVIPPPRWVAGHRAVAMIGLRTARVGGLGWQTDPYAK